jgi:hypothetical protein
MRGIIASISVVYFGLLAGCSTQRRAPYANDPVLLHYKPTLNDSATIMAEKQAHHGPAKPPMPTGAQEAAHDPAVARTMPDRNLQPAKAEAPGQLLAPPPGPEAERAKNASAGTTPDASSLPVRPPETSVLTAPDAGTQPQQLPVTIPEAVALNAAQPTPDALATTPVATNAEVRSADGTYAHDSEYHRVQGVLERHYRGYYCVRYCDPSVEDQYGGKFRLVDDQRIKQFNEGDVIAVEGEMIPNGPEEYNMNPRFKINLVRLVRKN